MMPRTASEVPETVTTFQIEANQWGIKAHAYVATAEQADEVVAAMPRAIRARRTRLWFGDGTACGAITFDAKLDPNAVNGGVNETGIKRYRALRRWIQDQGITVEWQVRSASEWTEEHLEMVISTPGARTRY